MATLINDIHEFIGFLTKKGTSKYFTPEQKTDAIHFASMQAFNKYFGLFEQALITGKSADNQDPFQLRSIPEALRPFLKTATLSTTSQEVGLPTDYAYPISIFNGNAEIELIEKDKVQYRKKREISFYKSENGKVSEDYQPFIKKATVSIDGNKRGNLPADYVLLLSVVNGNAEIEVLEHGQKSSKRRKALIDQCRDYPNVREDIQPFLKKSTGSITNKEVPLPDDYVHMVAIYFGGKEVYVINQENELMFKRERVVSLLKDLAREKDGYRPLLKQATLNLTNNKATYPDDFVEHVYSCNATTDYEPVDPNMRKYRQNSVIVKANNKKPICIPYADFIEYIGSSVTQVTMDYIGLTFATIEQDKIRIKNNLSGSIDFVYIALPTATLYKDYLQLHNAGISSVDLTYLGLPVAYLVDNKLKFETDLTDFSLTYLKLPTKPKWAYTSVNSRPVFDAANSVDIEWNRAQHLEIIKGALTYLGVAVEDNDVIQYFDNKKQTGT